jgi:hypothetical protein
MISNVVVFRHKGSFAAPVQLGVCFDSAGFYPLVTEVVRETMKKNFIKIDCKDGANFAV